MDFGRFSKAVVWRRVERKVDGLAMERAARAAARGAAIVCDIGLIAFFLLLSLIQS